MLKTNVLNHITQLQKRKTLLFVIGALLSILLGAKESNFLGLTEKSGQQILNDISRGVSISKEVKLSNQQKKEIQKLINSAPDRYSPQQKVLISEKSGEEILDDIKSEKVNVKNVYLNYGQHQQIVELITQNPENYNDQQTYLLRVKPPQELLIEIGNGIRDPNHMKLSKEDLEAMKKLIQENPDNYNDLQKIILTREE